MITALIVVALAVIALIFLLWTIGAREPAYKISAGDGPHWFIAVRGQAGALAPGVGGVAAGVVGTQAPSAIARAAVRASFIARL